jgi:hypothetical protein
MPERVERELNIYTGYPCQIVQLASSSSSSKSTKSSSSCSVLPEILAQRTTNGNFWSLNKKASYLFKTTRAPIPIIGPGEILQIRAARLEREIQVVCSDWPKAKSNINVGIQDSCCCFSPISPSPQTFFSVPLLYCSDGRELDWKAREGKVYAPGPCDRCFVRLID